MTDAVLGAAALRYVYDNTGAIHPFGEIGRVYSPGGTCNFDATIWAAAAQGFAYQTNLSGYAPGIGVLSPALSQAGAWAAYGVRVGYRVADAVEVSAFADGVSGAMAAGAKIHFGGGAIFRF
jgi:hypothetical protein